jgi:hypothetical protein
MEIRDYVTLNSLYYKAEAFHDQSGYVHIPTIRSVSCNITVP